MRHQWCLEKLDCHKRLLSLCQTLIYVAFPFLVIDEEGVTNKLYSLLSFPAAEAISFPSTQ